jgi:fructose-1-phosphate kinase PfkB-like protein
MSGTIASGGPANLYFDCTRMTEAAGALSVVDAQGAALTEALKAKPGLAKPNRTELAATVGRPLAGEMDLMQAMRESCERGAQRVVVTAGTDPALAFDGRNFWRIIAPRMWRLLRGDDLGEACRWGSAAGAANALTPMPGEADRGDVDRLAREVDVQRI